MSATTEKAAVGFRTASEIAKERGIAPFRYAEDADPVVTASLIVRAEAGIEEMKRVWNEFLGLRDLILSDLACYDEIEGHKEMNRTGTTRLAVAFGLSIAEVGIEEGRVEIADTGGYDYRFRVRIRVSKGARFVDGVGSCRMSEISEKAGDLSRREHFALTKAWTRATKRAIADILGGTGID